MRSRMSIGRRRNCGSRPERTREIHALRRRGGARRRGPRARPTSAAAQPTSAGTGDGCVIVSVAQSIVGSIEEARPGDADRRDDEEPGVPRCALRDRSPRASARGRGDGREPRGSRAGRRRRRPSPRRRRCRRSTPMDELVRVVPREDRGGDDRRDDPEKRGDQERRAEGARPVRVLSAYATTAAAKGALVEPDHEAQRALVEPRIEARIAHTALPAPAASASQRRAEIGESDSDEGSRPVPWRIGGWTPEPSGLFHAVATAQPRIATVRGLTSRRRRGGPSGLASRPKPGRHGDFGRHAMGGVVVDLVLVDVRALRPRPVDLGDQRAVGRPEAAPVGLVDLPGLLADGERELGDEVVWLARRRRRP